MQNTYLNASNTATGGTALGGANTAIEVYKLVVGKPTTSANFWVFSIANPGGSSNANVAFKFTYPGTIATGTNVDVFDLTDGKGHGIRVENGGNFMVDSAAQATLIWDYASDAST